MLSQRPDPAALANTIRELTVDDMIVVTFGDNPTSPPKSRTVRVTSIDAEHGRVFTTSGRSSNRFVKGGCLTIWTRSTETRVTFQPTMQQRVERLHGVVRLGAAN